MTCKLKGPSFKDLLPLYWKNNIFVDTKIHCSNGILNAHRMVLTVGNGQFATLLKDTDEKDEDVTTIVMPEFSMEEANRILSQMYGVLVQERKSLKIKDPETTEEKDSTDIKTEAYKVSSCEYFDNDMDNVNLDNMVEVSSRKYSPKIIQLYHQRDNKNIKTESFPKKITKILQIPSMLSSKENNITRKPNEANFVNLLKKEGNNWICLIDGCVYQHNQKQYVKLHINTHQEKRVCDWCGASIAVNSLARHIKRMHTKDTKTHKCNECDYESIETERLKVHMSKYHGAPRRFQCPTCGERFHGHKDLSKHKYIKHSERKLYKCDDCSKEFKHSTNYSNHIKMHKGIRPYKCKICDFSFTRKDKLKEHINRHTGEKPFKCDKCPLTFGNSGSLSIHKKSHNILDSNF